AEDRPQVLCARVQRAGAARPAPLVGVEGVALKVVVLVGLARELGDVDVVAVHRPEPPGPVAVKVQLALPAGDHLGDRAPDAAGAAEAVERKAGGHVEPAHPRHRADQRGRVGRHRVGVADELDDARVVETTNAPAMGAICGPQSPPATTTTSVSIGPASVSTALTALFAVTVIPVARRKVSTRAPSLRAAAARACVAVCGSR